MSLLAKARAASAALVAAAVLPAVPASAADYTFEADYRVALGGVELGRAIVSGNFDGTEYRIDGRGKLTGLLGAVMEYSGSASAAGELEPAGTSPSAFSVDATDGEQVTKVRMTLVDETVRRLILEPPLPEHEHPARVVVKDAHKRGVIDPMSALMVVGAGKEDGLGRGVCDRTLHLFNGRERFDIELSFKTRTELRESGYAGPAVVCEAHYKPIAGHRSDRKEVKYFASQAAEVTYMPVAGADIAIPFRVTLPTPIGTGSLTVVGFESEGALTTRRASLGAR